jgi:hypothetical protein
MEKTLINDDYSLDNELSIQEIQPIHDRIAWLGTRTARPSGLPDQITWLKQTRPKP